MANRLRIKKISRVSLVPRGDDPNAHIVIAKHDETDILDEMLADIEKRDVGSKERENLQAQGHTLPGTTSYPIKSAGDLSNAIQAWGRAKPEDRDRLKKYLMREAKRLGASQDVLDRIKNLGGGGVSKDGGQHTAYERGVLAMRSFMKGEGAGHPFRGNQFTRGKGGGGKGSDAGGGGRGAQNPKQLFSHPKKQTKKVKASQLKRGDIIHEDFNDALKQQGHTSTVQRVETNPGTGMVKVYAIRNSIAGGKRQINNFAFGKNHSITIAKGNPSHGDVHMDVPGSVYVQPPGKSVPSSARSKRRKSKKDEENTDMDVTKIEGLPEELADLLSKDDESAEFFEGMIAAVEFSTEDDGTDGTEDLSKEEQILAKADPEVRALIEKAQSEAEQARTDAENAMTVAKREQDARLTKEFIDKASVLTHLPVDPNEVGPLMKELADAHPELYAKVEQVLVAADTAAADVFKEFGVSTPTTTDDASLTAIEKAAAEIRSSNTDLTAEEAYDLALQRNPDLYASVLGESQ